LAGTSAHINVALTSAELIPGTAIPFSLTIDLPVVNYNTAPLMIEAGVLKYSFTGTAVFDTSSSKTVSLVLANSRATTY
jgi:hypothetical protein